MYAHLLLTGFDPFGGSTRNPSIELAQALHGEVVGGLRIVAQQLPCEFANAPRVLKAALARWSPVLVLALGQAAGRCELSLERVAVNLIDARIADNAGDQPIDQPVQPGGPAAYFTTLPIKAMAAAARAAGAPAALSYSAGSFVCNQVFYALQHLLAGHRPAVRSGFMHLPLLPEQACSQPGQPSMSLDTMVRGLRAALVAATDGGLAPGEDLKHSEGRTH